MSRTHHLLITGSVPDALRKRGLKYVMLSCQCRRMPTYWGPPDAAQMILDRFKDELMRQLLAGKFMSGDSCGSGETEQEAKQG